MFKKLIVVSSFGLAAVAFGAETSGPAAPAKTITVSMPDFSFAYKFEVLRNDDGLVEKEASRQPDLKTKLHGFHLGVDGAIDGALRYHGRVNLLGDDANRFDEAYVEWTTQSKSWAFRVGHQKINVYAFEQRDMNPTTLIQSIGLANHPFEYAPALMLAYNSSAFGMTSLQIVQDTSPATGWNVASGKTPQPAATIEWFGSGIEVGDGELQPLVQVALHDQSHSRCIDTGVKFLTGDGWVSVDYIFDTFGQKLSELNSAGKPKTKNAEHKRTNLVLRGEYKINTITPFAHYSVYNLTEYTAEGVEGSKVNAVGQFNDNGRTIAFGAHFASLSQKLKPYLAYELNSGLYKNSTGDDKTLTRGMLRAGLVGKF